MSDLLGAAAGTGSWFLTPDVPAGAPGVPPVLLAAGATISPAVGLATADAASLLQQFLGIQQWGIFDRENNPVITGETCEAFDFRHDFHISDYPVEDGSFASYDKVYQPYDVRMVLTTSGAPAGTTFLSTLGIGSSGSVVGRGAFLTELEDTSNALDLFNAVTPEAVYPNVNIVHYELRRTRERGATLLHAEIWLRQVRLAAASSFVDPPIADQPQQQAQTSSQATQGSGSSSGSGVNPGATQSADSAVPTNNGSTQTQSLSAGQQQSTQSLPSNGSTQLQTPQPSAFPNTAPNSNPPLVQLPGGGWEGATRSAQPGFDTPYPGHPGWYLSPQAAAIVSKLGG